MCVAGSGMVEIWVLLWEVCPSVSWGKDRCFLALLALQKVASWMFVLSLNCKSFLANCPKVLSFKFNKTNKQPKINNKTIKASLYNPEVRYSFLKAVFVRLAAEQGHKQKWWNRCSVLQEKDKGKNIVVVGSWSAEEHIAWAKKNVARSYQLKDDGVQKVK